MFKNKRNPAVSTESGAYDYGDALPSAGHRDSSEDEGDQSKGRSVTRRLTDEVRKLSMTMIDPGVRGQRSCKVQMEVDLHHVSLISMKTEISFWNKKGWLWKARVRGDRWLRRYFILQGQLVVYFNSEKDSKPKGSFLLHSYANVSYDKNAKVNGRYFNLEVDTPERTYYLSAESHEDAQEWGYAFTNCCGEAHKSLFANKNENSAGKEAEEKLELMQTEYSKVLMEMDERVEQCVAKEKKSLQQEITKATTQSKVELASLKEELSKARGQLYQWQHLAENLLNVTQSQDMFLGEEQKEKLGRMNENFANLSKLLQEFAH